MKGEKQKEEKTKDNNNASTEDLDYLQEQIELFSNKIKAKPGQLSSFNAVTRNDKAIVRNYLGEQLTQGPIYRPDYK